MQRLCRAWKATIDCSIKLQRKLFSAPASFEQPKATGAIEPSSQLVGDVNGQGAWTYCLPNPLLLEHRLVPYSYLEDDDSRQDLPGHLDWEDDEMCGLTLTRQVTNAIQLARSYPQSWQHMYLTQPPSGTLEQFLGELVPTMTATHGKVYVTRSGGASARDNRKPVELQDERHEPMIASEWMGWVEQTVGLRRHYRLDWADVVVRWVGMPFLGEQWEWWSERLGEGYKTPVIEDASDCGTQSEWSDESEV